jgi:hypothetical protein
VRVGRERLRQFLHARGISFQRTRTWKESHDPDRDAKLDRIEYVTSHYPDRCFGFGQFGPLSIRPCHGACWARRKKPVRLRATCHRTDGIRYFHGCYSLGDDQLWGVVRHRKGADHTLAALKSIRGARPGGYRQRRERARVRSERPATLGPPEAPAASRMTNLADVHRQRTRRAGSRGVPAAGYVERRRPSAPNLRRPAPAGSPDGGKGRPTSRPGRHSSIVCPPQRSLGDPRPGRGRRS